MVLKKYETAVHHKKNESRSSSITGLLLVNTAKFIITQLLFSKVREAEALEEYEDPNKSMEEINKDLKVYGDFWHNVSHIISIKNEHSTFNRKLGRVVHNKIDLDPLLEVRTQICKFFRNHKILFRTLPN